MIMTAMTCSKAAAEPPAIADEARQEVIAFLRQSRPHLFEDTFDRPFFQAQHTTKSKDIAERYIQVFF